VLKPQIFKNHFDKYSDQQKLEFGQDGILIFLEGKLETSIAWSKVYDLLTPTMFGLLEDLIPGSSLFEEFYPEWLNFETILQNHTFPIPDPSYGEWVYYPRRQHLVRFAPRHWHKISILIRNSSLLYPKDQIHQWREAREKLDQMVLAVAGASVGSQMLHVSNMLMRPSAIKIADAKNYQLNNSNRVRLSYQEFGRNKAEVVGEQLLDNNPFTPVFIYSEGVHANNIKTFVGGSTAEPKATLLIEETDDVDMKILLREEARRQRIPVVMVTDIGRAAQVDVRRFDLDPNCSLVVGMSDDQLYGCKEKCEKDSGSRQSFLEMAFAMSGEKSIYNIKDFKDILLQEVPPEFAGIPQLGSAAAMAAGLAAWYISRIVLGYSVPERVLLDPDQSQMQITGGLS
jgi:tRNA A37 threonylcarbamoyladenosine dehydratase